MDHAADIGWHRSWGCHLFDVERWLQDLGQESDGIASVDLHCCRDQSRMGWLSGGPIPADVVLVQALAHQVGGEFSLRGIVKARFTAKLAEPSSALSLSLWRLKPEARCP